MILNKKDVERRLLLNPEPPEVKEMRKYILESFKNLEFIEEGHIYNLYSPDGSSVRVPSVSSLIEEFVPKVDWDKIKKYSAKKNNVTVDELTRQWEETNIKSTNNGTSTHLYGENLMKMMIGSEDFDPIIKPQYEKGYLIPYSPKQDAIQKYWQDLFVIPDIYPLLPEVKMYMPTDNRFGIKKLYCGTADITLAFKDKSGEWCILLQDYKGLPLDTPIAVENGWKEMKDLAVGDKVFDKDGNLVNITGVSNIHHNPCVKITFDNNQSIICDEDHRWLIDFYYDNHGEKVWKSQVFTAKELQNYLETIKSKRSGYKIPRIKLATPFYKDKPDIDLPIDPWVFGVWLGDGNSADGKVTNMYKELWNEIEKRGYKVGKDVSAGSSGKASTRTVFGLTAELRKLGCLKNKHIPDLFIRSSYNQRFQILQGLMDTDGYYNPIRNRYVLSTTKKTQATFCQQLLGSLGIKCTILNAVVSLNGKKIPKFDVCFSTDLYPFLIRKIKIKKKVGNNRHTYRSIKSIESLNTIIPTRCIEVDSPSHTYCFGYDMIVTHNTNKEIMGSYARKKGTMMLKPFDDLIDEPLGHYTIQLNLYSLMLMNLGFKVIDKRLIWLKEDGTYDKIPLPDITEKLIKYYS